MLILFVTIILVTILLYLEYKSQDCIGGKQCTSSVPPPSVTDTINQQISQIILMVRNTTYYVTWRLSLIVALLLAIPIVYLIVERTPTIMEWLVTVIIIFIGVYFSSSWLWTHWISPNAQQIERSLVLLQQQLESG